MFAFDPVFRRVFVDHLSAGGARISWEYTPGFDPASAVVARIEVGNTGLPDADDWKDAGVAGTNVFSLVDPVRRVSGGKLLRVHYRVVLFYDGLVARSQPVPALGWLLKSDWLQAREVVRQFRLQNQSPAMVHGWLLKRRWEGTPVQAGTPQANVNPLTGELLVPYRKAAAGVEFVGGYFPPIPYSVTPMSLGGHLIRRDDGQARGTVDDKAQRRVVAEAFPMAASGDVFVSDAVDLRYAIHDVDDAAIIRDVPVLLTLSLRQLEFTDPAYQVVVPDSASWGGIENATLGANGLLGPDSQLPAYQFGPDGQ